MLQIQQHTKKHNQQIDYSIYNTVPMTTKNIFSKPIIAYNQIKDTRHELKHWNIQNNQIKYKYDLSLTHNQTPM